MKHLMLLVALFSAPVYASDIAFPPIKAPHERWPSLFTSDNYSFMLDELSMARTGDSVSYGGHIAKNGLFTNVVEIGNCRDQTHLVILTNGVLANASGTYKLQPVKSGTVADQVLNTVCRETEEALRKGEHL